jgi:hypothetical protein
LEALDRRRGEMTDMRPSGGAKVRVTFHGNRRLVALVSLDGDVWECAG